MKPLRHLVIGSRIELRSAGAKTQREPNVLCYQEKPPIPQPVKTFSKPPSKRRGSSGGDGAGEVEPRLVADVDGPSCGLDDLGGGLHKAVETFLGGRSCSTSERTRSMYVRVS
jgi:hypothetical protein